MIVSLPVLGISDGGFERSSTGLNVGRLEGGFVKSRLGVLVICELSNCAKKSKNSIDLDFLSSSFFSFISL